MIIQSIKNVARNVVEGGYTSINVVYRIDLIEPQGIIKSPCKINGNYVRIKKGANTLISTTEAGFPPRAKARGFHPEDFDEEK